MKALILGTGGVGESMAAIAKRRDPDAKIFETLVLADYDLAKAEAVSQRLGFARFPAAQVDGFDAAAVAALASAHGVEIICNFLPMNANLPVMEAALLAGVHYLDTAL